MLPDSITALCKNQPNLNDLHGIIRQAHYQATNGASQHAQAILSEYMMHHIENKYLSVNTNNDCKEFMEIIRKRYVDCANKEATRLVGCLSSIPIGKDTTSILCMTYLFAERLLNSVDFEDETNRSIAILSARETQDYMTEFAKQALQTPLAKSLC